MTDEFISLPQHVSGSEPVREPCPAPLAWQEIAQSFHQDAQSGIISTPHAELTVTSFGEGRPIVFLPAMGGTARLFCLTAWLLKDQYRSLIMDPLRFHRRPSPGHFVSASAEAISMTLEHFCPQGADVYASLFSSQIALAIMARRPQTIRSAFLQSAWAHRTLTWAESLFLRGLRFCPLKLRTLPLWQSMTIENHRRWFPPFDETRFGFLLQELGETRTSDLALQLLAATKTDLRPELMRIHQRILVLHSEGEGQGIASEEETLEAALPHIQREELYHSGLYPYLTHPQRLIKLIKPFWPA